MCLVYLLASRTAYDLHCICDKLDASLCQIVVRQNWNMLTITGAEQQGAHRIDSQMDPQTHFCNLLTISCIQIRQAINYLVVYDSPHGQCDVQKAHGDCSCRADHHSNLPTR